MRKIVPAGPRHVQINIGTSGKIEYTWQVAGPALTFTKVKDREPDRSAVFWGVWKRK